MASGRSRTRTWDLFLPEGGATVFAGPELTLEPNTGRGHRPGQADIAVIRRDTGTDWALSVPRKAPTRRRRALSQASLVVAVVAALGAVVAWRYLPAREVAGATIIKLRCKAGRTYSPPTVRKPRKGCSCQDAPHVVERGRPLPASACSTAA